MCSLQKKKKYDGSAWADNVYPMIASKIIVENVGFRIIEYDSKIKASKLTTQYKFQKGLNLFGGRGYSILAS